MADKTIKHFVFSRFFPRQDPKYPHDVFDVNFLSTQLPLAKNILGSLENQTNKNFELIFFMNSKFFDEPKYEFIFSTLKDSTTLPIKFIKESEIRGLVESEYNEYDFVIQSRMDFDDFIFQDAVEDTQGKVEECENILAYGYCKGYEYIYGELYPFDTWGKWGKEGHISILQSLILKSSFAQKIPYVGAYSFDHTKIKLKLKEFLEKNGLEFSERMFQQNTFTNAYVYFRHECSHLSLTFHSGNLTHHISKKILPIFKNITKKQLEEEFGFFYDLNSIK